LNFEYSPRRALPAVNTPPKSKSDRQDDPGARVFQQSDRFGTEERISCRHNAHMAARGSLQTLPLGSLSRPASHSSGGLIAPIGGAPMYD